MALWLKFQYKGGSIPPSDQLLKKILFKESIENFIGIENKKYEIWKGEIFEELGGEILFKNKNYEEILRKIETISNLDSLLIKTDGKLKIKNKNYHIRTIIFNSKKYKKVYGDMELDFTNYSFEDYILDNEEFNKNLSEFITQENDFVTLWSFVISDNPDAINDIRYRIKSYNRSIKNFVDDFFSTLKIWSEEERKKPKPFENSKIDYSEYFTQFNTGHLSKLIEEHTKFFVYCKKIVRNLEGLKLSPGSIFLEADDKKYFEELFFTIKKDFKKVKDQWFSEDKLKHALRKWFEGQHNLDDDFKNKD